MEIKKCIAEVAADSNFLRLRQCHRNAAPGSNYCKQHDPERIKKAKEAKLINYEQKDKNRKEAHERMRLLSKMAEGIPSGILDKYELVLKKKK
jgi:hypothetical protein